MATWQNGNLTPCNFFFRPSTTFATCWTILSPSVSHIKLFSFVSQNKLVRFSLSTLFAAQTFVELHPFVANIRLGLIGMTKLDIIATKKKVFILDPYSLSYKKYLKKQNKLECLSLASLFSRIWHSRVRHKWVGICKICAKQKILFIYEMIQNEILLKLKDFQQNNLVKYQEILLNYLMKFALLSYFLLTWMKVNKIHQPWAASGVDHLWVSSSNIRTCWKRLPVSNTLAYYLLPTAWKKKKF
jgi:hypothetical protein